MAPLRRAQKPRPDRLEWHREVRRNFLGVTNCPVVRNGAMVLGSLTRPIRDNAS